MNAANHTKTNRSNAAEEERQASWMVFYSSAGCLPDNDPDTFDSLQDAVAHVCNEFNLLAMQAGMSSDVLANAAHVQRDMGADDPRMESLYRWTIEQVVA